MLHMRRKTGESFVINDSIRITVIDVKGRTVQLGLEGPPDTRAFRAELYDKIKAENQHALDNFDVLFDFLTDKKGIPPHPLNHDDTR